MNLFDLHCDTPYRIYREHLTFASPSLSVRADAYCGFDTCAQVFAFWSDKHLTDDRAYTAYRHMIADFRLAFRAAPPCLPGTFTPYFAVEDGRLLCGDLNRLYTLRRDGIAILTLQWSGENIIGGAYDTDLPLRPFGHQLLPHLIETGILPDISHASDPCAAQVLSYFGQRGIPVLATHSGARAVCPHPRNLPDDLFCALRDTGGVLGLTLYPPHLSGTDHATTDHLMRHIEHFLALGGEHTLAIGTDFDGIDRMPDGLYAPCDLIKLADKMSADGYPEQLIADIFYNNAARISTRFPHPDL